jgi:anti-sigma-K factor RskA
MAHQDYKEMLTAAALGALDASEAQLLETHLRGCADCRQEHDQWQETAAWLALTAETQEPSQKVRTELLKKIRSSSSAEEVFLGTVVKMPSLAWSGAQQWGAIAAAITIVGLSVALFLLWRQNVATRMEMAQLGQQVEQTRQELARQREAARIVSSPGARMMELGGTEMAPAAHAMLAFDQSGRAVLMAKNLPPPPPGKAYQLWFIAGGNKMPGKLFTTTDSGDGMLSDQVPESARGSAVFAITLEPEQGVTSPTGQIYLVSRT